MNTRPKEATQFGIQQQLAMESSGIGRVAPLEAVLFDIDGTMAISDPFHHRATSEMLLKVGYNNGVPITPEFGMAHMAGRSNEQIGRFLFPDWDQARLDAFFAEKEALFARYAGEGLREIAGLTALCRWADERGLKRAAVTNAPRANAELMISILGLTDFFQLVVTAEECERFKPFPDPYLRSLELLGVSPEHAVVFEDSTTGVQAGVAAGMPVVAIAEESREDKLLAVGATLVIRDYEDPKLWTALDKLDTAKPEAAAEANGTHTQL
ncbi:haloacid dehalogenase-like hydrolase domain-containing protein Sgpp isoform X1 [Miscanthus floridulus]|uniref:haloacid dehalogenase-like hydrolase domain-containing protein Sgpp isoform X1 n=1 Tax=Miscanthus floridulus TaxID=154761 RepID=UPI003458479C